MYSRLQMHSTEILYSTVQMVFGAQINLLALQQQSRGNFIISRNLILFQSAPMEKGVEVAVKVQEEPRVVKNLRAFPK